jgi:hypothetical protein
MSEAACADFMGVAIMVGMLALSFRRYVLKPTSLTTRDTTLLNPKARRNITRDSAIVTATFFTHNFMRMLEESFHLAQLGHTDSGSRSFQRYQAYGPGGMRMQWSLVNTFRGGYLWA